MNVIKSRMIIRNWSPCLDHMMLPESDSRGITLNMVGNNLCLLFDLKYKYCGHNVAQLDRGQ